MGKGELFDISGKIVVITGGAGALGGSMAAYLLTQGAKSQYSIYFAKAYKSG